MSFSVNPFHDLSSALHSGEPFASDALGAGECAVEDGAKGFEGRLSEAAKVLKNMSPSDIDPTSDTPRSMPLRWCRSSAP
jgi:hypothetical protein